MARTPRRPLDLVAISGAIDAALGMEEERAQSLREVSRGDPVRGAPWHVEMAGMEQRWIEAGEWHKDGYFDELGLPPGCPVKPLGKEGDVCWFLDTQGAVGFLEAKSSGKGPIEFMFGGRPGYLEWAFPRFSKSGAVAGWDADWARQVLVSACAYRGYFSLEDQVRGRGAWKHTDGSLIFHAGDAVWIDGRWRPPGVYGELIYPARPKLGRPSRLRQPAGSDSAGDQLFELLQSFNWDRGALDARLMLGWLMTAKMGGALDRRPVVFVPGGEGSGKSTLQRVLRLAMNGALVKSSDTTQAGVYHHLQQDSIAILVDELEAEADPTKADKILALARIAYSGDTMLRGTQHGRGGLTFQLNSSFMASSITKPATDAADDSRMAVLMLRKREAAGGSITLKDEEIDAIGKHLMRRIFDGWPRWWGVLELFRKTLISVGHTDRACDTFAPLAAGCHLALSDELPTDAELAQWGKWLKADELAETSEREDSWRRCLAMLLKAQPDAFRNNTNRSVEMVLDDFRATRSFEGGLQEKLAQVGLAISWANGEVLHDYANCRLFIPNSHPATYALFAGTRWAGKLAAIGPWVNQLRQAPRELWFSGVCGKGLDAKARGTFIHLAKALEWMG